MISNPTQMIRKVMIISLVICMCVSQIHGFSLIGVSNAADSNFNISNPNGNTWVYLEVNPNSDIGYAYDTGNILYAYYLDNQTQKWSTTVNTGIRGDIFYSQQTETIYFAGGSTQDHGDIFSFYESNGSTKWSITNEGSTHFTSITIGPNKKRVYVGTAFNDFSVNSYWVNNQTADFTGGATDSDDVFQFDNGTNSIYAGMESKGTLKKIDIDGNVQWENRLEKDSAFADINLEYDNNFIFAGSKDGDIPMLHKYDSNGNIQFNFTNTTNVEGIDANQKQEIVAIASSNGILAINYSNPNNNTLWTFNESTSYSEPNIDIIEGGNTTIYAINTNSNTIESIDTGLTTKTEVTGIVEDRGGNSISNANVRVYQSGSLVTSTSTNNNGNFNLDLEDGSYEVNVTKTGFYSNNSTTFTVPDTTNLNIKIERIPAVSGIIINKSSKNPVNNSTVRIFNNSVEITNETTDNNDGRFGFSLDNGTYTLNVTHQNYKDYEQTITINGNTSLGDIEITPKEYNLVIGASPWQNHGTVKDYTVWFNDDVITENATTTSSNSTILSVNQTTFTLNATDNTNLTGEINITATYNVDGKTLRASRNVTVAPLEMKYIDILSPLYASFTIAKNTAIQYIVLTSLLGAFVAYVIGCLGGIAIMMISLIIGWVAGWVGLGILLSSVFGGIFIMLNNQIENNESP